jgi:hypothetical protein
MKISEYRNGQDAVDAAMHRWMRNAKEEGLESTQTRVTSGERSEASL